MKTIGHSFSENALRLAALSAALAPGGQALAAKTGGASRTHPNIVLIVADDLGWGDVGFHGSVIPTPHIDALARDGIELTRFYTAPVSSPTRCGLLTGRYPSRFGIRETVIPPWRDYGLDEGETTLADLLGQNGYAHRAMIGKWHVGHGRLAYYPLNRGFTHFYGCLNGALDYFTHEREGELDWHNDWDSCYDKGYTTDLIAAEAVRCIGEYSGQGPFYLHVCFNAPHSPYQAPEEEIFSLVPKETFETLKPKDKKGWTYRAMVSRMDKGIGLILKALADAGLKDDTLVLFMSDNGGVPDMEPYCVNAPQRGGKFDEWEGGVHNVAVVNWPRGFAGQRKLDQVTGFVDVMPTIADIVGVRTAPGRPYDGISIYKVLKKARKKLIDRDIYLGVGAAVNQRYKYIKAGASHRMGLKKDYFTDIQANPSEKRDTNTYDPRQVERLRRVVEAGDAIVPYHPELPFDKGRKGFVAPKEWRITKP